jgi:FkbM family methyltransferase
MLYCIARGEPRGGDIHRDGEAAVQKRVIDGVPVNEILHVLDIGANIGDWTVAFLDQLEIQPTRQVRLHAFEPVKATRAKLEANFVRYSAAFDLRVHDYAVSDSNGTISMHIIDDGAGRNSIYASEIASAYTIEIEAVTLSDIFERAGIAHAHLVKIDAEGHDLAIMHGAASLLRDGRIDVLQFEYNHSWVYARSFLKDVFDLIEPTSYKAARICHGYIEVFDAWHPELERFFNANYVLVRDTALDWFDHRHGTFDKSNTYA